jgi:hypothetical protein
MREINRGVESNLRYMVSTYINITRYHLAQLLYVIIKKKKRKITTAPIAGPETGHQCNCIS